MRKILVIALIVLFALLPYKPEILEEDISKLGNNPGNIGIVEDENFCYYDGFALDDHGLYKASKDFKSSKKIADSMHGFTELNIYGDYIYFCDGSPGFLQRMTLDGKRKEYITFRLVRNVVISGNKIYYMISEFDNDWGKVYSCELNGKRKKYLGKEISEFCVDGNTIYYINMDVGDSLWAMDVSGKNKRSLGTKSADNLSFDEENIYYNEIENFGIYRMNKKTLQSECINEQEHGAIYLSGKWLYYCDDEDQLSRISKDGKIKEKLFDARVIGMSNVADSVFFQLAEGDYGRYRLDLKTKKITELSK